MRSDQSVTATFTLVPTLSGLKVSPHKLSLAGRKVSGKCVKPTSKNSRDPSCRRRVKLKISYTLNGAATVTFTLERKAAGRKVNGKCVKPTGKHQQPCKRMVTVPGELVKSGATGDNTFTFDGKIGGHKLGPGSYQLTATPTGGKPSQISFKIVP
jgi:hypothetical protein